MIQNHRHPFHLVDPSPWPLTTAFGSLNLTFGLVMYMHQYKSGWFLIEIGGFSLILCVFAWWGDVVREGYLEGRHTIPVQANLRMGVVLFIVSELMFFVAFFWAFFHSSLSPVPEIGGVWPPVGVEVVNPWGVPLLNTAILLTSGFFLTWSHHSLLLGGETSTLWGLRVCIGLALIFTALQAFEYKNLDFAMSDGIFGSVFYLSTGFHGFHVIIGSIFLIICLLRFVCGHFSRQHHLGFEAASWYWHFVDVVWLFLFVCVYWWGS